MERLINKIFELEKESNEMKKLMIQGTSSSAGKTTIVAGLCRILAQEGKKVSPFKSQNMSLNSYVDKDGKELSRATALQAEAACTEVKVAMNPILLKPNQDNESQVLVEGMPYAKLSAKEYFSHSEEFKKIALKNFQSLEKDYEYCILEGGGSPAEINLRQYDYVNMGMAELVDAPVVLIANIEGGGVFASLYGTILLLEKKDRERIKGILINKFRGDLDLLQPGITMLEEKIRGLGHEIPVLGVIPHIELQLEEEDSLSERYQYHAMQEDKIVISIIQGKQMGNVSDFQPLLQYSDVVFRYVSHPFELGEEDLIVLAGSKNTLEEVEDFHKRKLSQKILELHQKGTPVLGICGGFQALGELITDTNHIDGSLEQVGGLHLFPMKSTMEREKIKKQVEEEILSEEALLEGCLGMKIKGYEIHHGQSSMQGAVLHYKNAYGTYIHGLFENDAFTKVFLNNLRKKKNLLLQEEEKNYKTFKEEQYNRLAETIRNAIDMKKMYQILG